MGFEECFKLYMDCLILIAEIKTRNYKRFIKDSETQFCNELKDCLIAALQEGFFTNPDFGLELQEHQKYLTTLARDLKSRVAFTANILEQREKALAAAIVIIYDKRKTHAEEITQRQIRIFAFQKLLLNSRSRLSQDDFRDLIETTNNFVINDTCLLQEAEFNKEIARLKKDYRRAVTLQKLRTSTKAFEVNGNIIIHPRLFAALCNKRNLGRHITFKRD